MFDSENLCRQSAPHKRRGICHQAVPKRRASYDHPHRKRSGLLPAIRSRCFAVKVEDHCINVATARRATHTRPTCIGSENELSARQINYRPLVLIPTPDAIVIELYQIAIYQVPCALTECDRRCQHDCRRYAVDPDSSSTQVHCIIFSLFDLMPVPGNKLISAGSGGVTELLRSFPRLAVCRNDPRRSPQKSSCAVAMLTGLGAIEATTHANRPGIVHLVTACSFSSDRSISQVFGAATSRPRPAELPLCRADHSGASDDCSNRPDRH